MAELPAFQHYTTDLVVDNSILKDMGCSTLGAMKHVLHLETAGERVPIVSGQAAHEALAWYFCGKGQEEALGRFDTVYRKWSKQHVQADDRLAWQPLRRILGHWMRTHPLDRFPLRVDPREVEMPIAAVLGYLEGSKVTEEGEGRRVVMVALLDMMGKQRTGGRWPTDHKTTQYVNDYFKDEQQDSSQFTGQLWILKKNRVVVPGVYVNALEFRAVPGSTRKCSTHGTTYAECGLQHCNHQLFPVTRSPHELEYWAKTARQFARRYVLLQKKVETIHDVRELPMEGRFLRMCRGCSFREWCRVGRPAGAEKTFVKRTWDPLEHARELAASAGVARGEAE